MTSIAAMFITILAFFTATLSGIFGMAGGLVLMGGLALVLPVSAAFVTHGVWIGKLLVFMRWVRWSRAWGCR